MDTKTEVRDFLTSRRAKITAAEAGLTTCGTRQVLGLRREEVATLAGVSVGRHPLDRDLSDLINYRQALPILDLPLPDPPPRGLEWIAAYGRWAE
jgi:hypothetical protein